MPLLCRLLAASLALLVFGASASPAAVLCVADDGHLALKGSAGSCSHPGSHGRGHGDDRGHGHGHGHRDRHGHGHGHDQGHDHGTDDGHGCHPCVDVPLLDAPPAASAPALDLSAPPAPALPVVELAPRLPPAPSVRRLVPPPPRPPLHLRSLRSVVLTC